MKNIHEGADDNFEQFISSEKITIVDLWAEWCGPCLAQIPILEEFSKENQDIQIVKINVDKNGTLSAKFSIRSIPTLIFFQNGEVKERETGAQNLSQLNEIINKIKTQNND